MSNNLMCVLKHMRVSCAFGKKPHCVKAFFAACLLTLCAGCQLKLEHTSEARSFKYTDGTFTFECLQQPQTSKQELAVDGSVLAMLNKAPNEHAAALKQIIPICEGFLDKTSKANASQ